MTYRISEMEPSQRPRERLVAQGAPALSDAELLAILLRIGRFGYSAIAEAQQLLADCGGLAGVAQMSVADLKARPGIGTAKAAALLAALELGRRIAKTELDMTRLLNHPNAAGQYLVQHLTGERREVFGFLSLNSRHGLLKLHELTIGTAKTAPVDPAELFRRALLDGAAGVIAFHNHPSGALEPSADDLTLTRRLSHAGGLLGVPMHDHLVVAGCRWLSLRSSHPDIFQLRLPAHQSVADETLTAAEHTKATALELGG